MRKPNPLNRGQLKHPKNRKSGFNGDKWRSSEEQGFAARRDSQRLSVVEGTRQPSGLSSSEPMPVKAKQPVARAKGGAQMNYTAGRGPTKQQAAKDERNLINKPELTARQKKIVKS